MEGVNGDDDEEEIEVKIEDNGVERVVETLVVVVVGIFGIFVVTIKGITFVGKLHAGFVVQPKPLLPAGE